MSKVIYEDEYVRVAYKGCSEINTVFSGDGAEYKLRIENVSNEKLRVSAADITANGVMVEKSELLDGELKPGKKSYGGVHFYYKMFNDVKSAEDLKDVNFNIKYEIGDSGVKKINGPIKIEE